MKKFNNQPQKPAETDEQLPNLTLRKSQLLRKERYKNAGF